MDKKVDTDLLRTLCPVCSKTLSRGKKYVACGDHYFILIKDFDRAWNSWETSQQLPEDELTLMKVLLDGNTAENKPSDMKYQVEPRHIG